MAAHDLDFFAGGVPAGTLFQLSAREIKKVLSAKQDNAIGETLEEICYIGLIAYFEAFCRDCFASLINICPMLLERLKSNSYDVNIDSLAALEMGNMLCYNIGFLVAVRFDFGSARKINALYSALIGITPFSKDEIKIFDEILSDRNLLVHHGGIYTYSYFLQRIGIASNETRPFFDSLRVDTDYFNSRYNFLYKIAEKVVKASHAMVTKEFATGSLVIDPSAHGALNYFNWWDEE